MYFYQKLIEYVNENLDGLGKEPGRQFGVGPNASTLRNVGVTERGAADLHDSGNVARSRSTLSHLDNALPSAVREWTAVDERSTKLIHTAVSYISTTHVHTAHAPRRTC